MYAIHLCLRSHYHMILELSLWYSNSTINMYCAFIIWYRSSDSVSDTVQCYTCHSFFPRPHVQYGSDCDISSHSDNNIVDMPLHCPPDHMYSTDGLVSELSFWYHHFVSVFHLPSLTSCTCSTGSQISELSCWYDISTVYMPFTYPQNTIYS